MASRVHFIVYEPPLAAYTACNRPIGYVGEVVEFRLRGALSTNPEHVTCKSCLGYVERWRNVEVPRVLPVLADYEASRG